MSRPTLRPGRGPSLRPALRPVTAILALALALALAASASAAPPVSTSAPPDRIAFASNDRELPDSLGGVDANIWTVDPDTGAARRLTDDPANDRSPAWSPHGRLLAFTSDRAGSGDIWVMPASGRPERPVTGGPADDHHPQWSPDGRAIAFVRSTPGDSSVWTVSARWPAGRRIASGGAAAPPRWSPDGRRLAFDRHDPATGAESVWIAAADGSDVRQVGAGRFPSWSPDGELLAFGGAGFVAGGEVTVVRTSGALQPRVVTRLGGGEPAWTPDGSRLVYIRNTGGDGESQLRRVDREGAGDVALTPGPGWSPAGPGDFWPQVSPDGRRVVFVSGSTEPFDDIALVSLGGGDQRLLAADGLNDFDPTWRPAVTGGRPCGPPTGARRAPRGGHGPAPGCGGWALRVRAPSRG